MNKPKLEEYGCGDIIIRYKNNYTYFSKDQLRERIKWLKSQITLNDVSNRNVVNAINEAFKEILKE